MTLYDRINGLNQGVAYKAPVRVATTADITLSGAQTIDGVAVVENDRVLVKDQTDPTQNGIYIAYNSSWQRAADFDGSRDVTEGTWTFVLYGTISANIIYKLTTADDPVDFGTSNITFAIVIDVDEINTLVAAAAASAAAAAASAAAAAASAAAADVSAAAADVSAAAAEASAITAADSAGLMLLGSYTAANATSVDIGDGLDLDAVIDGVYDFYELHIIGLVPVTDGASLQLQTSANTGAVFDSGASDYSYSGVRVESGGATVLSINDTTAAFIRVAGSSSSNNANESFNAVFNIFNPAAATFTFFKSSCAYTDASGPQYVSENGGGLRVSAAVVDALRFYMSAGNIASGTFHLYGVRKS